MLMISRVRRCASQRSVHEKTARVSTMLKAAKTSSTSSVQGSRSGRATVVPIVMPSSQRLPTAGTGSNRP